jgi:methanogenic corrinoid protein MtbC1
LAQAVEFYAADVVGLSVSQAAQLPALQESIAAIRGLRTPAQTKILVGGRALQAAPQAVRELGVDGYAADPRQAVALARSLVGL